MADTAVRMDCDGWLRGIAGAVISGGSGAVVAAFSVNLLDSKDWSPMQGGGGKLLELIAMCFFFSALISLMKFLQTHPVPDDVPQVLAVVAPVTLPVPAMKATVTTTVTTEDKK